MEERVNNQTENSAAQKAVDHALGMSGVISLSSLGKDNAAALGEALLKYAGVVGFELVWEGHENEGWGGRAAVLEKLNEDAESWAKSHVYPYWDKWAEETNIEKLIAAYKAGWYAAPKPISFPVR